MRYQFLIIAFFLVNLANAQMASKGFSVTLTKDKLKASVYYQGRLITNYYQPESVKKPVLFPLNTLEGTRITRGYPIEPVAGERVDHPHHVGVWFNFGDVNGHDFWNNSTAIGPEHKGPFGEIKLSKIEKAAVKKGKVLITAIQQWNDKDGKPMLDETVSFEFAENKGKLLITRTSSVKAKSQDVVFTDNKEGLLAIRLRRELEHPSTKPEIFTDAKGVPTSVPSLDNTGVTGIYTSSTGKSGDEVWGTAANWVKLDASIENKSITVAILDNPNNYGYPTHWHARGYGLFSANPLGDNVFDKNAKPSKLEIRAGETVKFKHQILVSEGKTISNSEMNEIASRFQNQLK